MKPPPPPPPDEVVERALQLAREAAQRDEVPVGAVVVGPDGALLAEAHNHTENLRDPTAHAERLALAAACAASGTTRLPTGSLLAATLEPCAMCAGALVLARAAYLVFGALDPKAGACGSLRDFVRDPRLNHRVVLLPRLREAECGELLTRFFAGKRGPLPGRGPRP